MKFNAATPEAMVDAIATHLFRVFEEFGASRAAVIIGCGFVVAHALEPGLGWEAASTAATEANNKYTEFLVTAVGPEAAHAILSSKCVVVRGDRIFKGIGGAS